MQGGRGTERVKMRTVEDLGERGGSAVGPWKAVVGRCRERNRAPDSVSKRETDGTELRLKASQSPCKRRTRRQEWP